MKIFEKIKDDFYIKTIIKSWLFLCVAYSFIIFQFIWGNHDWNYLIRKVNLSSGFFEARYSIHLFQLLFFDGNILPVMMFVLTLLVISIFVTVSLLYLGADKKDCRWLIATVLIGVLPYNYVMLYYFYTSFSVYVWALVGVLGLICVEQQFKWYKFLFVSIVMFLVLGSYPPIIAMLLVLFVAKRICCFLDDEQNFTDIIKSFAILGAELILGYLFFKLVVFVLEDKEYINTEMYNLQVVSFMQIVKNIFIEIWKSIESIWNIKNILGWQYVAFLSLTIFSSVLFVLFKTKNKLIMTLLLLAIFVASRFSFIVSSNSYIAEYRVQYWGILGITIFSFAILLKINALWQKNIFYVLSIVFICLFIKTGFDIQKTMVSIYKSEIRVQNNIYDRISKHPNFDIRNKYQGMSFGYPLFWKHFCNGDCENFNNEALSAINLPLTVVSNLFWDKPFNPIYLNEGIMESFIWTGVNVDYRSDKDRSILFSTKEEISKIRNWMYVDAKVYPNNNSIYIDDKQIILYLQELDFYKNREKFLYHLKQQKKAL